MTAITKNIIEAFGKMGEEKMKAAGSLENLVESLKEYGVEANLEEVQAALEEVMKLSADKQELDEDSLGNVAGGFNPALLLPLVPYVVDGAGKLIDKIKGNPKKPEQKPATPTTAPTTTTAPEGPGVNQTTTNNTNVVNQNNVNKDNITYGINFA